MMEKILGVIEKDFLQKSLGTDDRSNYTEFLQRSCSNSSQSPFEEFFDESLMDDRFLHMCSMINFAHAKVLRF